MASPSTGSGATSTWSSGCCCPPRPRGQADRLAGRRFADRDRAEVRRRQAAPGQGHLELGRTSATSGRLRPGEATAASRIRRGDTVTIVIGVGAIGGTVAGHLVTGGEVWQLRTVGEPRRQEQRLSPLALRLVCRSRPGTARRAGRARAERPGGSPDLYPLRRRSKGGRKGL